MKSRQSVHIFGAAQRSILMIYIIILLLCNILGDENTELTSHFFFPTKVKVKEI